MILHFVLSERAVLTGNISKKLVTPLTSQLLISLENLVASWNIWPMLVALDVSQPLRSWLRS